MSIAPISIVIDGVASGWASANVSADGVVYRMDGFSYTTKAFDDFVRFGVDIALDAYKSEIIFDGEPSGWEWSFDSYCLRISELISSDDPNSPRTEVFKAQVERDQLATAVLDAVNAVVFDLSVEGFEAAWLQAYPIRGVKALEAALATARRPEPDLGDPIAIVRILGSDDD